MLNWKNNENDALFDEICKKKKAKIKIKFQKMKGTFWIASPDLKVTNCHCSVDILSKILDIINYSS